MHTITYAEFKNVEKKFSNDNYPQNYKLAKISSTEPEADMFIQKQRDKWRDRDLDQTTSVKAIKCVKKKLEYLDQCQTTPFPLIVKLAKSDDPLLNQLCSVLELYVVTSQAALRQFCIVSQRGVNAPLSDKKNSGTPAEFHFLVEPNRFQILESSDTVIPISPLFPLPQSNCLQGSKYEIYAAPFLHICLSAIVLRRWIKQWSCKPLRGRKIF